MAGFQTVSSPVSEWWLLVFHQPLCVPPLLPSLLSLSVHGSALQVKESLDFKWCVCVHVSLLLTAQHYHQADESLFCSADTQRYHRCVCVCHHHSAAEWLRRRI